MLRNDLLSHRNNCARLSHSTATVLQHSIAAQYACTVLLHNALPFCWCTIRLHSIIAQCFCTVLLHNTAAQDSCTVLFYKQHCGTVLRCDTKVLIYHAPPPRTPSSTQPLCANLRCSALGFFFRPGEKVDSPRIRFFIFVHRAKKWIRKA